MITMFILRVKLGYGYIFSWSARLDLNQRPLAPKACRFFIIFIDVITSQIPGITRLIEKFQDLFSALISALLCRLMRVKEADIGGKIGVLLIEVLFDPFKSFSIKKMIRHFNFLKFLKFFQQKNESPFRGQRILIGYWEPAFSQISLTESRV